MARCDACNPLSIQGVGCHEHGCPNTWLHPFTGEPESVECEWCGSEFQPEEQGQRFCDESCWQSYNL